MQSPGFSRRASGRGGIIFRRTSSININLSASSSTEPTSIIMSTTTTTSNFPRSSSSSFRRANSKASAAKVSTKAMADCEIFLSSNKLGNLLSDLPVQSSEWLSTLKRSLSLWQSLDKVVVSDSNDQNDGNDSDNCNSSEDTVNHHTLQEVDQNMWETTCRILKGTYYVQEELDLNRLHDEAWHDYALHAAVGLTSLRPGMLNGIIERLVQHFPMELQKVDPQTGRLPLHVVTATKYRPERLPILETLLAVYPKAAGIPTAATAPQNDSNDKPNSSITSSCCDSNSRAIIYPLHLACQAGYPWKGACQDLYKAAPHVGTEVQQPWPKCPAELQAIQSKASLILEHDPSWESVHDSSSVAPPHQTTTTTTTSYTTLSSLSSSTSSATSSPLPRSFHHNGDHDNDNNEDNLSSSLKSFMLNVHGSRSTHDTATISSGGDGTPEDLLFLA